MPIRKPWLYLSTALLGASLASCSAPSGEGGEAGEAGESGSSAAVSGEGGEGGEAGEGGAANTDLSAGGARVYVYGQMRGHLAVAKALYDAGDPVAGGPHFMHPIVEVIAGNADQFNDEMRRQLTETIEALALAAQDGSHAGDVQTQYDAVIARLDAAMGTVTLSEHAEGLSALIALARVEYGEGVVNGEVDDVIEYQDAWGFIVAARAAFDGRRTAYEDANSEAAQSLDLALTALQAMRGPADADPPAALSGMRTATTRVQLGLAAFEG